MNLPRSDLDINQGLLAREFRQFFIALRRIGYVDFVASICPVSFSVEKFYQCALAAEPGLSSALRLLFFSDEVCETSVEPQIRVFVPLLLQLSLLRRCRGGRLKARGLSLLHRAGLFFFAQISTINPVVYFGDDSIALSMRLGGRRGETSLDLCSGPGLQGLLCARVGMAATLVEIHPFAAAIARVNAAINGLENVRVVEGDLFGSVDGRRYDIVTANPPLLPSPPAVHYPFVGDGGLDGLAVTWRILDGLKRHLAANGYAQIIGTCLGADNQPCPVDRFKASAHLYGLDILMTCIRYVPFSEGSHFFEGLSKTAALNSSNDLEETRRSYINMCMRANASQLCLFFLTIFHGTGRFDVLSLNSDSRCEQGLWFV